MPPGSLRPRSPPELEAKSARAERSAAAPEHPSFPSPQASQAVLRYYWRSGEVLDLLSL